MDIHTDARKHVYAYSNICLFVHLGGSRTEVNKGKFYRLHPLFIAIDIVT